jgi:conjugal transfer pilus assembly protein TraF
MLHKLIMFFALILSDAVAENWKYSSPTGWNWYRESKEIKQSNPKKHKTLHKNNSSEYSSLKQLEEFQKKMDAAKAKAVLYPTVENVTAFIKLYNYIISKSSQFQEMWTHVNMTMPDPEIVPYGSPKSRSIKENQEKNWLNRKIKKLSLNHGLFFVFKSGCRFCHEFAPLVKNFSEKYGFEIKAISADGGKLPDFPDSVLDNGVNSQINPDGIYPALFIVNPKTKVVLPIAWGMVNEDDLEANLKHWIINMEHKS